MSNVPQDSRIVQLISKVDELETKLTEVSKLSEGYTFDARNWTAVKATLEITEQRIKTIETQIESVKNLVMQVQAQFQQFNQQRAIELSKMVNYGTTQRDEDSND